ncbi:MAG: UDP-N-acetylmuramoyl-L-alanyl-D-glutamate--2,6-diaminopimelate ligase [Candidatus Microbacterium phytovorans]|uniref:UDP-N-acetylmuramyl-tripeptide synthetase n=1 Tax=Candidatus Microbacterium phytovorans TaxID=3121374 RepID=A0AAJ5W1L3_9MICO|nr:UDP-N-acetylmuramoyl-L-alanyl-D-glutamate--2,6-diaminopimelate ligase [Microbacterium sp.]WEK13945.1 MAG: UDP-N-acetylmuramoyl-L-alanyl-D-glutamate--2,6-diaminopimelate ligase [Microbacterium sp.]
MADIAPTPPVLRPENPPGHLLAELAARFAERTVGELADAAVTGITLATADLRPGEVFVALQGVNRHGAEFSADAAAKGAIAVLTDEAGVPEARAAGLPVLVVEEPRSRLGEISSWVYGTDRDMPLLLAITGTNGKTSVSHLVEGMLRALGMTTGLSSTAERHIAGQVIPSRLTTPESSEMHALLALMRERGVEAAMVEVSAQALSRHRVDGIVFDVAGFTNLTHDHLDDYGDMATYLEAKLDLFRPERSRRAVVCVDSPEGREVARRSSVPVTTVLTPALADGPVEADWTVDILEERQDGTWFRLHHRDGRDVVTTVPVIGGHMASNAGLAIVMLLEAGVAADDLFGLVRDARIPAELPGRIQRVSGPDGPAVYIDFAHSPDAFVKTLDAVRHVTPGRVIMVTAANGDRDVTKRAEMGATAAQGSDILVITDQHPRSEDPAGIRTALIAGARAARPDADIHEVVPPERAIEVAVQLAAAGDAIVWAGPGHQHYREISGVRVPFDAAEAARAALTASGWPTDAAHGKSTIVD